MPLTPSTRWCPTPEQLMILEEMYRSGNRTPSASQIQQITAHLSLYGKIEGKNVFYWFQNHKARDRQKLRKRLGRHHPLLHQLEAAEPYAPSTTPRNPQITANDVVYQGCFQGVTAPGLNLVGKLEAAGSQEECLAPVHSTALNRQWTMDACLPLKTLDLFPVKSTGVKEDCGSSKSSSCSTSTS